MPKPLSIRTTKDGNIDAQCLVGAGVGPVKEWLQIRLSGIDPYFPIDKRTDENPDALVVTLLRHVGSESEAADVISRAILDLLDDARKDKRAPPAYFENALRVCQQVRLRHVGSWFGEELQELAMSPAQYELEWGGYEKMRKIVLGAVVQVPGFSSAASREYWETLLLVPQYCTFAFQALNNSMAEMTSFLQGWWATCNDRLRLRELKQIVFRTVAAVGVDKLHAALKVRETSFASDLKQALNAVLQSNGLDPVLFDSLEPNGGALVRRTEILEAEIVAPEKESSLSLKELGIDFTLSVSSSDMPSRMVVSDHLVGSIKRMPERFSRMVHLGNKNLIALFRTFLSRLN